MRAVSIVTGMSNFANESQPHNDQLEYVLSPMAKGYVINVP
ncbi:MAG: hypothetical protein AAED33_02835 [Paracoccaceae bacterium]